MTSEEKSFRGCWWALLALIALSFVANIYFLSRPEPEPSVVIKRDTVWEDTTIYKPLPAETVDIGKTVYLRIPQPGRTDTLTVHDSIDVPVPISQVRYDDSLYTAWVSGFCPALDSIRLHQPTIIIERTYQKPAPRLSVGLQTGAGIGIFQHRPDIYVGFGLQYRLWPK